MHVAQNAEYDFKNSAHDDLDLIGKVYLVKKNQWV